mmetsp:Transcript_49126/g.57380  ORF Transcript_49126/g.57380 Transcript_49126/m.57380 type:complete len:190 (+) Transcript_49126:366-935(+)|eukprot:CAMPEP_0194373274 /NCGR_PEP_ID=MMETSP0174-20130528/21707_1 /TAXON_ID=216777 /ORGANISM="Proboscia alata, Strain PI-D3" /LENGTH=189 /DNA_ID=CAMNT_0039152251 /DNA_START=321 /DNA_END=890 /DNA_ORIENTATION=-
MVLTVEQRELMEKNRKKALEIRRKKKDAESKVPLDNNSHDQNSVNQLFVKKIVSESMEGQSKCCMKQNDRKRSEVRSQLDEGDERKATMEDTCEVLEDFEIDAPLTVSKKEAMQVYCLPKGTLAICAHTEKENPHYKSWSAMKLYDRTEVRKRARERFGGLDGLVDERNKRQNRALSRALDDTKDLFKM